MMMLDDRKHSQNRERKKTNNEKLPKKKNKTNFTVRNSLSTTIIISQIHECLVPKPFHSNLIKFNISFAKIMVIVRLQLHRSPSAMLIMCCDNEKRRKWNGSICVWIGSEMSTYVKFTSSSTQSNKLAWNFISEVVEGILPKNAARLIANHIKMSGERVTWKLSFS